MAEPDPTRGRLRVLGRGSFVGFLLVMAAVRMIAPFTESVNWDEFALLQRAETLASTGVLQGGGRPGLVNLILVPFAEGCRNAVVALTQARHLWTLMVLAGGVAFWLLLRGILPESRTRWAAVATGVGLWVLASHFLRYSVQVRTDQPAVLLGLWGGVALLASRRRPAWALAAGALFALGFLATQKLIYVAGVAVILVGGWHLVHREVQWRREATRLAKASVAFLAVVLVFRMLVAPMIDQPTEFLPVASQLRTFDYYREHVGFRYYRQMLPSLLAQVIVVGLLFIVTLDWIRSRGRHGAQLLVAWTMFAAMVVVVAFHAARFPYFYIVLGLFPAAIGALVLGPMLERLQGLRQEVVLLAVIWVPLSFTALAQAAAMLEDDVTHQRESLAFVEDVFPSEARGFEGHAAFTCRHDPDPFRTRFYMHVLADFRGSEGLSAAESMLAEFRARPVQFMIEPLAHEPYPLVLRNFWHTRYALYHGHVRIPGREVEGGPGWEGDLEVIVPGTYRWWPTEGADVPLRVDGATLGPGDTVALPDTGLLRLVLPEGGRGLFALAVDRPPRPDTTAFFRRF